MKHPISILFTSSLNYEAILFFIIIKELPGIQLFYENLCANEGSPYFAKLEAALMMRDLSAHCPFKYNCRSKPALSG